MLLTYYPRGQLWWWDHLLVLMAHVITKIDKWIVQQIGKKKHISSQVYNISID